MTETNWDEYKTFSPEAFTDPLNLEWTVQECIDPDTWERYGAQRVYREKFIEAVAREYGTVHAAILSDLWRTNVERPEQTPAEMLAVTTMTLEAAAINSAMTECFWCGVAYDFNRYEGRCPECAAVEPTTPSAPNYPLS